VKLGIGKTEFHNPNPDKPEKILAIESTKKQKSEKNQHYFVPSVPSVADILAF
jgi:hypothetical protein